MLLTRHVVPGQGDLPMLVWRFDAPATVIASAPRGGGIGVRHWVLNAQVADDYARLDPDAHIDELAHALALDGSGVGMLTAANVDRWCLADDGGVEVAATVGLGTPTWAAAPDIATAGSDGRSTIGTINLVVWVPEPLTDAALVNAVATATEAKAQALLDADIDGTGTATDAVVVACPTGERAHQFGGPRSTWGAPLARAVHRSVLDGSIDWLARVGPERADSIRRSVRLRRVGDDDTSTESGTT